MTTISEAEQKLTDVLMFVRERERIEGDRLTEISPYRDPLTVRQVEVLKQAARGLNLKESAAETGHSENLIKHMRREIFWRLEARTMAHAVAIAYEEGILP